MKKRVLLVGGSMHGKWMDIDRRAWNVCIPKPLSVTSMIYDQEDPLIPDFAETYYIERVPVEFMGMRCVVEAAIWSDLHGIEKTKAVISALFQRDIAEMFSEGGWDEWISTTA